jgi:hypothetical protein
MKIQLTVPTNINENELYKLPEKTLNQNIWLFDPQLEKGVLRFRVQGFQIQLTSKSVNITFESRPEIIKWAMLCLYPLFEILSKDKETKESNFLRILKITPQEWKEFSKSEIKEALNFLEKMIEKYGIPNKSFNRILLISIIKSGGKDPEEFLNFLNNYKGLPKVYKKIFKEILK